MDNSFKLGLEDGEIFEDGDTNMAEQKENFTESNVSIELNDTNFVIETGGSFLNGKTKFSEDEYKQNSKMVTCKEMGIVEVINSDEDDSVYVRGGSPPPTPVTCYEEDSGYDRKSEEDADQSPFNHRQTMKKFAVCKFYLQDFCLKQNLCDYMHSEFPCKYYYLGLVCPDGDDLCKLQHGRPLTHQMRSLFLNHLSIAPKTILGDFPKLKVTDYEQMFDRRELELQELYNEDNESENVDVLGNLLSANEIQKLKRIGVTTINKLKHLSLAQLIGIGMSAEKIITVQMQIEQLKTNASVDKCNLTKDDIVNLQTSRKKSHEPLNDTQKNEIRDQIRMDKNQDDVDDISWNNTSIKQSTTNGRTNKGMASSSIVEEDGWNDDFDEIRKRSRAYNWNNNVSPTFNNSSKCGSLSSTRNNSSRSSQPQVPDEENWEDDQRPGKSKPKAHYRESQDDNWDEDSTPPNKFDSKCNGESVTNRPKTKRELQEEELLAFFAAPVNNSNTGNVTPPLVNDETWDDDPLPAKSNNKIKNKQAQEDSWDEDPIPPKKFNLKCDSESATCSNRTKTKRELREEGLLAFFALPAPVKYSNNGTADPPLVNDETWDDDPLPAKSNAKIKIKQAQEDSWDEDPTHPKKFNSKCNAEPTTSTNRSKTKRELEEEELLAFFAAPSPLNNSNTGNPTPSSVNEESWDDDLLPAKSNSKISNRVAQDDSWDEDPTPAKKFNSKCNAEPSTSTNRSKTKRELEEEELLAFFAAPSPLNNSNTGNPTPSSVNEESWDDDPLPAKSNTKINNRVAQDDSWDEDPTPAKKFNSKCNAEPSTSTNRSKTKRELEEEELLAFFAAPSPLNNSNTGNPTPSSVNEESWDDDPLPAKSNTKINNRVAQDDSWDEDPTPPKKFNPKCNAESATITNRTKTKRELEEDEVLAFFAAPSPLNNSNTPAVVDEDNWDDDFGPKPSVDQKCGSSSMSTGDDENWDVDSSTSSGKTAAVVSAVPKYMDRQNDVVMRSLLADDDDEYEAQQQAERSRRLGTSGSSTFKRRSYNNSGNDGFDTKRYKNNDWGDNGGEFRGRGRGRGRGGRGGRGSRGGRGGFGGHAPQSHGEESWDNVKNDSSTSVAPFVNVDDNWDDVEPASTMQTRKPPSTSVDDDNWDDDVVATVTKKPTSPRNTDDDWDTPTVSKVTPNNNNDDWDTPSVSKITPNNNDDDWDTPSNSITTPRITPKNDDDNWDEPGPSMRKTQIIDTKDDWNSFSTPSDHNQTRSYSDYNQRDNRGGRGRGRGNNRGRGSYNQYNSNKRYDDQRHGSNSGWNGQSTNRDNVYSSKNETNSSQPYYRRPLKNDWGGNPSPPDTPPASSSPTLNYRQQYDRYTSKKCSFIGSNSPNSSPLNDISWSNHRSTTENHHQGQLSSPLLSGDPRRGPRTPSKEDLRVHCLTKNSGYVSPPLMENGLERQFDEGRSGIYGGYKLTKTEGYLKLIEIEIPRPNFTELLKTCPTRQRILDPRLKKMVTGLTTCHLHNKLNCIDCANLHSSILDEIGKSVAEK